MNVVPPPLNMVYLFFSGLFWPFRRCYGTARRRLGSGGGDGGAGSAGGGGAGGGEGGAGADGYYGRSASGRSRTQVVPLGYSAGQSLLRYGNDPDATSLGDAAGEPQELVRSHCKSWFPWLECVAIAGRRGRHAVTGTPGITAVCLDANLGYPSWGLGPARALPGVREYTFRTSGARSVVGRPHQRAPRHALAPAAVAVHPALPGTPRPGHPHPRRRTFLTHRGQIRARGGEGCHGPTVLRVTAAACVRLAGSGAWRDPRAPLSVLEASAATRPEARWLLWGREGARRGLTDHGAMVASDHEGGMCPTARGWCSTAPWWLYHADEDVPRPPCLVCA